MVADFTGDGEPDIAVATGGAGHPSCERKGMAYFSWELIFLYQ